MGALVVAGQHDGDVRRRAGTGGGDQFSYTAAVAATLAVPAAVGNANLNIQVHGGIGMTWEHPVHTRLKRAKSDQLALGTPQRHRADLAVLLDLTL